MFHYFDQLREKPLAVRRKYTLLMSAGIVAVIGLVWLVGMVHRFTAPHEQAAAVAPETPSPLSSLLQNIVDGVGSVKADISENNPFTSQQIEPAAEPQATSSEPASNQVIITDPEQ